jgi:hypothetical protein
VTVTGAEKKGVHVHLLAAALGIVVADRRFAAATALAVVATTGVAG